MAKLKVLLADDHRLMLAAVRRVLAECDEFDVVGQAQSGSEVLPLVGQTKPDLVLLDLHMPEMDGLTCLDRIRARFPDVRVVMLSAYGGGSHVRSALDRGANGYVVKTVEPAKLVAAVLEAARGEGFVTCGADEESGGANAEGLTERELGVLALVTRGLSNRQIAKELWVTEQTVKFHLRNVFRKLGVANRTEASRRAREHGLVDSLTAPH